MPEIELRPAISSDIPALIALDHNYSSDYVWQMEVHTEQGYTDVSFREVRLPRSVQVIYPRPVNNLPDDWTRRSGLLVAVMDDKPIGYVSLMMDIAPVTAWVTDFVVTRRLRRQGVGSALIIAAQDWSAQRDCRRIVLEMQPKNYPALRLARKLGFHFCGYNDRYYANHDIGLFFAKPLR